MSYKSEKIELGYFYKPEIGSFGFQNHSNISFISCREEFCEYKYCGNFKNKLFFYHNKGQGRNIARFINNFENKLKLKNKTMFYSTNSSNVTYIKICKFWESSMRFSLFTILLRCGTKYKKNNFKEALLSNNYIKNTQKSVDRFLKGYTKYTGNFNGTWDGWFSQFGYKDDYGYSINEQISDKELSKLLVKPGR